MTDSDLVAKLRERSGFQIDGTGHIVALVDGDPLLDAAADRIAELEKDRNSALSFTGATSLSALASCYMTAQANWDLTLDRAEAAEALLEEARGVLDAGTRSLDTARSLMLSGCTWGNSAGYLTDAALWIDRADARLRAFLSKLAPSSAGKVEP